jgi:large subunit ribosomal protein L32
MPNPKRKHTPHRRDCRRSANSKLTGPNLGKCPNCGIPKEPHRICTDCGYYDGKLIVARKVKKSKTDQQSQEA